MYLRLDMLNYDDWREPYAELDNDDGYIRLNVGYTKTKAPHAASTPITSQKALALAHALISFVEAQKDQVANQPSSQGE